MNANIPISKVDYEFECPDSPEEWSVHRFHYSEGVNACFQLSLELVTSSLKASSCDLLGFCCETRVFRDGIGQSMYGVVSSVEVLGINQDRMRVGVVIESAFSLMGLGVRSRIFHQRSVKEIVTEVLQQGLASYQRGFDWQVQSRGNELRDYCVQYQESDRDFVLRLLQEEGINYYFRHDEQEQREYLVLFESTQSLVQLENIDGTPHFPVIAHRAHQADLESIAHLSLQDRMQIGQVSAAQWRWQEPSLTTAQSQDPAPQLGLGLCALPPNPRPCPANPQKRSSDAMEVLLGQSVQAKGSSYALSLRAGTLMQVQGHPVNYLDATYVITQMSHVGHCPELFLDQDESPNELGQLRYENEFLALPAQTPLRPAQTLQRPRIFGPQTAVVCGPAGEQIHTNEHGQVMLKFHWERAQGCEGDDPCWVRVAQGWAGPGWGAQFLPRVGMEVVVEFLEGNPDRPLVTGCVYNGQNRPPFSLPKHKTQSGFRTHASDGRHHELRFEDQRGAEEIYLRSQRNFRMMVTECSAQVVGSDKCVEVGKDYTHTVMGNASRTVEGDRESVVMKNSVSKVGLHADFHVLGQITVIGEDLCTAKISGDAKFKVEKDLRIDSTDHVQMVSGLDMTLHADQDIVLDSDCDTRVRSGKSLNVSVVDEMTINVGASTVRIKADGTVEVSGTKVTVKSSGTTNVTSDGVVNVKGTMIKLNA